MYYVDKESALRIISANTALKNEDLIRQNFEKYIAPVCKRLPLYFDITSWAPIEKCNKLLLMHTKNGNEIRFSIKNNIIILLLLESKENKD